MRTPSARILINTVSLQKFAPSLDPDSATIADDSAYGPPFASNVPCSAQPQKPSRDPAQQRIGASREWKFIFGANPGVTIQDRITLTGGCCAAQQKFIVTLTRDLCMRGGAWEVFANELV
jgi:hypothetical protein